jgi:hypothetical protein
LCPLCPFMCLPVSRLFWVSSLAYPNLLGTKGYVVVVVVVVVVLFVQLNVNLSNLLLRVFDVELFLLAGMTRSLTIC